MPRPLRLLGLSVLTVLAAENAFGASGPGVCQIAVLRNGFTIDFMRQGSVGAATRLWLCNTSGDGYIEVPTEQIESFEQRQAIVPLPAPPPPSGPQPNVAGYSHKAKDSIQDLIAATAFRHLIDPDFVASVVKAESGGNAHAVSRAGARGLMQLMPATAANLGVNDAMKPGENVRGGTAYLDQLLVRYHDNMALALAAYNAGPAAVDRYHGIPPYRETRAYVARVIHEFNRRIQIRTSPAHEAAIHSASHAVHQAMPAAAANSPAVQ